MLTLSGQEGIDNFNRLLNYRLPAWEDLPSDIQSRQFQRFVQHELGWLFPDEPLLTGYMLQNYLKWDILPPVEGRKYNREHVAWCLVISLLKQVLSLDQVKLGILMQYRLMPIKDSYEVFREVFRGAARLHPAGRAALPGARRLPRKLAPNRLATGAALPLARLEHPHQHPDGKRRGGSRLRGVEKLLPDAGGGCRPLAVSGH